MNFRLYKLVLWDWHWEFPNILSEIRFCPVTTYFRKQKKMHFKVLTDFLSFTLWKARLSKKLLVQVSWSCLFLLIGFCLASSLIDEREIKTLPKGGPTFFLVSVGVY